MRLIANFKEEKEAFVFSTFLKKKEIFNVFESHVNAETQSIDFRVWVVNEDQIDDAFEWLERFRQNPSDTQFVTTETASFTSKKGIPEEDLNIRVEVPPKRRYRLTLTNFLIVLCGILFFWNASQEATLLQKEGLLALQVELTQIQQKLLFDYPQSFEVLQELIQDVPLKEYKGIEELPPQIKTLFDRADAIPYWRGIVDVVTHWKTLGWKYLQEVPLFEKIREGEFWRLFTPCLLHKDILHILFNMAWLFVLGRQIEERLRKGRMILLIVIVGVISNLAQYLMGGPYFLGFSGIVVGLVGFIWMRQRLAPWEGYPLHRSVTFFVFIFVAAMFGLEIISWLLQLFNVTKQSPNIANTAHIIGGLVGLWLGKLTLFSRRKIA